MDEEADVDLLSAFIDTFDSDGEDGETPKATGHPAGNSNKDTTKKSPDQLNELAPAARKLEKCDIFSQPTNNSRSQRNELFGEESEDDDNDELSSKTALSENGADIRRMMKEREQETVRSSSFYDNKMTSSQIKNKWNGSSRVAREVANSQAIKIPGLGLSIVNPKVSMEFLKTSMATKEYVALSKVNVKGNVKKDQGDWITIGVVASKTEPKKSSAGNQYIIFRMADMANIDEEISLFLFGKSYGQYWKLPVGTTIGLMNPSVMKNDKGSSRSGLSISIHSECQLLVIGTSKDLSTCGATTKNGKPCTNAVNKAVCDKCRYHAMQAHKSSRQARSELNTTFSSKEPKAVQNRLLSKLATTRSADDCFTYAGRSYSTKTQKVQTKVSLNGVLKRSAQKGILERTMNIYQIKAEDQERITSAAIAKQSKAEQHLEELISKPSTASMQLMKHLVSKECGTGSAATTAAVAVKNVKASELLRGQKEKLMQQLKDKRSQQGQVELTSPTVVKTGVSSMSPADYKKMLAKRKAQQVIQKSGGLQKQDANAVRKKFTAEEKEQVKKRLNNSLDISNGSEGEGDASDDKQGKRRKLNKLDVNSAAYLEIRNKKSINSDLVKQVEADRESQYFNVKEKKESYETKLLGTHVIESEIYYCRQCDYQDWTLAKRCFEERHKYKKLPALKRFFKCSQCNERLITHERFPTGGCKKCGNSSYVKAGMINEKKVTLAGQELSLRGNEESRLGSFDSGVNLDVD